MPPDFQKPRPSTSRRRLRPPIAFILALPIGAFTALGGHAAALPATPADAQDTQPRLEKQRQAFLASYPAATEGDWRPAESYGALLADYALWPDLRSAYLQARVSDTEAAEIRAFIDEYAQLQPGRTLRYRYALHLSASGRAGEFRALYGQHYQQRQLPQLDCLAMQADIALGETHALLERATPLWLVSKSQDSACDPVFAQLRKSGELDDALYRRRYELAIEARNFSLAHYLAKSIDEEHQSTARAWMRARRDPADFLQQAMQDSANQALRAQLLYAVERLAYRQPAQAASQWQALRAAQPYEPDEQHRIDRHIALWAARRQIEQAPKLMADLDADADDAELRRWRARLQLRDEAWPALLGTIASMPGDESGANEWQYWAAAAHEQLGNADRAQALYAALAKQRNFYGFLSADALGTPYVFEHRDSRPEPEILARLGSDEALLRARELLHVGLDGRARSEWDAAIAHLTAAEKVQAAILASDWGWSSRAISTAASIAHWHDLTLRYPLPHLDSFNAAAEKARITNSWAYGIARSESMFMRDIRSSAGAVGLMQLMPATGRQTARAIKYPYRGLGTLTHPDSNIRLGTVYLGKMYRRFDQNPVLATAAYNAGPGNVSRWLPESGAVDARIWIENIPFNETRKYVRRVLEADTVFHWRMTGEQKRLSDELPLIVSAAARAAAAERSDGHSTMPKAVASVRR